MNFSLQDDRRNFWGVASACRKLALGLPAGRQAGQFAVEKFLQKFNFFQESKFFAKSILLPVKL